MKPLDIAVRGFQTYDAREDKHRSVVVQQKTVLSPNVRAWHSRNTHTIDASLY